MVAAVLTCLRLGWWQWERTQEATGTAQNFGYALLWPGFGVAFIYMWVRFLHLEVLKDAEDDEQTDRELREMLADGGFEPAVEDPATGVSNTTYDERKTVAPNETELAADNESDPDQAEPPLAGLRSRRRADQQRPSQGVTISVATVNDDDDDDPELTAYNQALAALAEEDRRRAR